MSRLAIAAETDADRFKTTTHVRCYECDDDDVEIKGDQVRKQQPRRTPLTASSAPWCRACSRP